LHVYTGGVDKFVRVGRRGTGMLSKYMKYLDSLSSKYNVQQYYYIG